MARSSFSTLSPAFMTCQMKGGAVRSMHGASVDLSHPPMCPHMHRHSHLHTAVCTAGSLSALTLPRKSSFLRMKAAITSKPPLVLGEDPASVMRYGLVGRGACNHAD